MLAADPPSDEPLCRTSSQQSTASRRSAMLRVKPRKRRSSTSLQRPPSASDKSLTSFPSLSPTDTSPVATPSSVFRSSFVARNVSTSSSKTSPSPSRDRRRRRRRDNSDPSTTSTTTSSSFSKLKSPLADDVAASATNFHPSSSASGSATVRRVPKSTQSIVGSLVASSPSMKSRAALFDDTPQNARDLPGNLHHASNESIEHALARIGSVDLVRQLAADLAQRDAQMTILRRKAEERERVLRKMLKECEVSHLDVETRLREIDRSFEKRPGYVGTDTIKHTRKRSETTGLGLDGTHPDDDMSQRMARALQDDVPEIYEPSDSLLEDQSLLNQDSSSLFPDPDTASVQSIPTNTTNTTKPKETTTTATTKGGWKSYLWNGGAPSRKSNSRPTSIYSNNDSENDSYLRTKAAGGNNPLTRKPLSNDLFMPPPPPGSSNATATLRYLKSQDPSSGDATSSRRSSSSVASWALRLVAGNNQSNREVADSSNHKQGPLRGRSAVAGMRQEDDAGRTSSMDSTRTSRSARTTASTNNSNANNAAAARIKANRRSLGPNGPAKSVTPESQRMAAPSSLGTVSPHGALRRLNTVGPVEMDTILPEDSRPPTLMLNHNNLSSSAEFLTDRFGFIYDQKRRKRQSEAAAALKRYKRTSGIESLGGARDIVVSSAPHHHHVDDNEDGKNNNNNNNNNNHPQADGRGTPERPPSTHSSQLEEPTDSQSGTRWYDFLKVATVPTELLSHTPSAAPITTIETTEAAATITTAAAAAADTTAKASPHVVVQKRGSLPVVSVNPEPAAIRIVSGNAEFASPTTPVQHDSSSSSTLPQQPDPVKALLEQLTDLHDSLQREKTTKWNEFLRKVRAERKREGEAVASSEGRPKSLITPEAMLTDGEVIGVAGLGNKGKVGRAKWREFKHLVLGGIPVAYRAKVWAECSGASALRVPGYYDDLSANGEDDPTIVSQIQMDITRTLTDNIFFRRGPGVHKLNEVLLAYSRRNPAVGYCQGMNLIAACLLLIMPTAEDAFWVLATMIEDILPEKYYDHSLLTSRADQIVLRQYVTEILPKLSAHLDNLGIELEALTFQWFLSVFTDCLSAEALFRVWDVVLCMHDGSTFLFQIALALLKLNEHMLLECDNSAAVYHYINHKMTNHAISIDGLIQASEALGRVVKRKDVEDRRKKAVEHETEVMRQREELRLERVAKRAAAAAAATAKETAEQSPEGEEDLTATATVVEPVTMGSSVPMNKSPILLHRSSAAPLTPPDSKIAMPLLSRETSRATSPSATTPVSRDDDDDVDDAHSAVLQNNTPLPIDEEVTWRA